MGLTLVAALSVHVVMLQGLHVPFPNNTLVAWPPRYLNMALAMLAMILFNDVATPWVASRSWLSRTVLLFLVFSMLREELVRAVVMDGVTTTAWTFSLLANLPVMLLNLVACTAIALAAPRLGSFWQKIAGAMVLAALLRFGCQPLIGWTFAGILNSLSFLAHAEIYTAPYGWQVLVPAYLTFAEPVVASFAVAFLVWDRLSTRPWVATTQLVLLITLMKGAIVPVLLYSPYLGHDLATAVASEGQFGLEALILAAMTAIFWQHSRRLPVPAAPAARRLGWPLAPGGA